MAKPQKCSRCGKENDPSFAFCLDCGQSLRPSAASAGTDRVCNSCGSKLLPGFRFCGHCGRPVDQPAGAPPPAPAPVPLAMQAAPPRAPIPVVAAPQTAPEGNRGPAGMPPRAAPPAPFPPPRPAAGEFGTAVRPVAAPSPSASPGSPGAHITVIRRDGQPGPSTLIDRDEVICGRTEGDLLIRDDPSVSPRHARFSVGPEGVSVSDLGSVNGTFLRLRGAHALVPGDEIRVGRQLLRLEPLPHVAARPGSSREGSVAWGSPDPGCRLRLAQMLEGGGVGEVFPLKPGENLLGREAGDVHFPYDRYVSGRHARIEVSESGVTVSDLGSSNGTFIRINGNTPLQPGDQLLVGMQLLRVDV